jgi:alpha-1,2-mannosyltransferase
MLRTVQFAGTLPKPEADALNAESGRVYTDMLVRHYRLYRKQGIWLAPKSGERLEDAAGEPTTLHAHSRDAAQQGFYKACKTAKACKQAGLDTRYLLVRAKGNMKLSEQEETQAQPARQAWKWSARLELALSLAAGALLVGASVWFISTHWAGDSSYGIDFGLFYRGALAIRQGLDPYHPALHALQNVSQQGTGSYYVYPPPFALALIPLTFLPFSAALQVWLAINMLIFAATIALLARPLLGRAAWLRWTLLLIICCATMRVVGKEIIIGQADLLLNFLIASSYVAYTRNRALLSGVLLALAAIVKPYLGLIFLYYLWKHAWRPALSFLLTSLACIGLSIAVVGWQTNLEWLQVTGLLTAVPHASERYAASLHALFLRLFTETPSAAPWLSLGAWPASLAALAISAAVALLIARAVPRLAVETAPEGMPPDKAAPTPRTPTGAGAHSSPRRWISWPWASRRAAIRQPETALEFALWVTGTLLVFPNLEDIHVATAVVPLVLLAASVLRLQPEDPARTRMLIVTAISILYWMNPLSENWQWATDVTTITGWHILETGTYLFGLLLLFAGLSYFLALRRSHASQQTRVPDLIASGSESGPTQQANAGAEVL